MDFRELLAKFDGKIFVGLSDYYPQESEVAFLKIRLEPRKLVIENKTPTHYALIVHEAEYDEEWNAVAFREKIDGKLHKEFSPEEINEDRYNIISGHFLLRDPRYVLRHGKDLIQITENSFVITAFEEDLVLFGKTSVKIEIVFDGDHVHVVRKKFVHGNKELKNQKETINFTVIEK